MCGFERHGARSQTAHQPRHEELQVRDPGDADVWETERRHRELVAPLGVTAVWVEQELQLVACFKCDFLKTKIHTNTHTKKKHWQTHFTKMGMKWSEVEVQQLK